MVARFTPETPLVTADWLKAHLGAPDVRVLDATWFMPGSPQTGRQVHASHHIPGARYFDIDDIADTTSPFPHMLPPAEKFASRARHLGLGDGHRIICYDQNRYSASCRAWWMFRAMGHDDVAVLDGGFDAWRTAGGEVDDLPTSYLADRHFTVRIRQDLVRDFAQMQEIVAGGGLQVVDARPAARFRGEVDEPRPGLRKGHMPGAINLPHSRLVQPDGQFKAPDDLKAVFADVGVDLSKPIVNSCGSGVTAAILAFAEALAGHDDASVYDASWCEWAAAASGAPVKTG